MKKKLIMILCIAIVLSGCNSVEAVRDEDYSRTGFVLGTIVTIKLLENGSEEVLDQIFQRLTDIENYMSVNIETSDVAMLNKNQTYTVSEDTYEVIKAGIAYGQLSEGKFDISLGPIINLWQIGTEFERVPSQEEILEQLSYVDYRNIQLGDGYEVTILPGASIDLGGIAKGYAADEVEKILIENNINKAIINLGGNIKVIGSKSDDTPYNIGIQGPEELRNEYLGIVEVSDKTVVTSGDYERFFIEDGIKYHHIFDTSTGYPYETEVAAVTVITDSSMSADALSTILFASTIEDGIALCKSLSGVECIYVTKDRKLYFSSEDIRDKFTLTDYSFTIQ